MKKELRRILHSVRLLIYNNALTVLTDTDRNSIKILKDQLPSYFSRTAI